MLIHLIAVWDIYARKWDDTSVNSNSSKHYHLNFGCLNNMPPMLAAALTYITPHMNRTPDPAETKTKYYILVLEG